MDENLKKEVKTLKSQVRELLKWKEERTKQQLTLPIDYSSMKALDNAFRETSFTEFHVTDIFFKATLESPKIKGQMRYFDDLTTQTMRITTTTNPPDAADFTGSIDLTAV